MFLNFGFILIDWNKRVSVFPLGCWPFHLSVRESMFAHVAVNRRPFQRKRPDPQRELRNGAFSKWLDVV